MNKLYVVIGFILSYEFKGYIGDNEVVIFVVYFKVLLDLEDFGQKGIGFVIFNEVSYDFLYKFVVLVDRVEEISGLDFYLDLLGDEVEEVIESNFNIDLWFFSKKKFED